MLFTDPQIVGSFKGFSDHGSGFEFIADIIAPYDVGMLDRPQLGQFLLIELGSPEEAALGRITRFVPSGSLTSPQGEDYVNTMVSRRQEVPEDLKRQRLKYRVRVKLLGAVRVNGDEIMYVPSQRRLPHLGARVALPSDHVLQELCKLSRGETELGSYVLGEFVFCGIKNNQTRPEMLSFDPPLKITFDIKNLVSRRSVVFARAGYGKSNLVKFLVAELYKTQPTTASNLPVGTLIFDPDGEYFWPDRVANRPGMCDVPHLKDRLVVFTNRQAPSPYYDSWKAGDVKLDIRDLAPRDVISIAISADRQEQQNILKLKSVPRSNWRELVDLIHQKGLQADDMEIGSLLGYAESQTGGATAEIGAARSNMNNVVRILHDPDSKVLSGTLQALSDGKVVVIDISLLSSGAGNMLAGLLMRRIFSHNQENFTGGNPIIPVVAIIEEAQSVLGRRLDDTSPYVEWVKEGRKYDLGAVLVTQQPGSMASELLSQADNWFCFHLLSEGDASVLGRYNSHYSSDILAHLIAEPIPGNCYMWSAPHQPFVLPVRLRDFGEIYGDNIRIKDDAARIEDTGAQEAAAAQADAMNRIKDCVRQQLNDDPKVRYYKIPDALPGGLEGVGIKSGMLYFLIKECKSPEDPHTEDELKRPALELLLGKEALHVKRHEHTDYYCATAEDWERMLGKKPKLSDP